MEFNKTIDVKLTKDKGVMISNLSRNHYLLITEEQAKQLITELQNILEDFKGN